MKSSQDIRVGRRIRCRVAKLVPHGAWCDVPGVGFQGLILVPDIGWGDYRHPGDRVAVGEGYSVEVLRYFPEEEVLGLGLKQVLPNPWIAAGIAELVGQRVAGRVFKKSARGVTVELSSGALGFLPTGESLELEIGETIEVTVAGVNLASQSMLLSCESM